MPVEINGLLHHNLSSETQPIPSSHYDVEAIRHLARLHDEGGYDRVLIANAAVMPDNISVAGHVGAVTERLGVMLAHRPGFIAPTMAARMLATLDHLMGGRLAVHIITGASDIEMQADGDYLSKEERYARSAEYIDILRAIWSSDTPVDHEGEYFRFRGGFAEIKPVQKSGVPVYFGGMSPAALKVAARSADTFATLSDTVAGMKQLVETVQPAAAALGRAPNFLMSIRIVLGDSEADAWRRADILRGQIAAAMPNLESNKLAAAAASGFQRTAELAERGDRLEKCFWNGINQLRGGQSNSGTLVGDADQIVDALMDYYDVGVNAFILRGFDPVDDTVRIGREILPALRKRVAERDAEREVA
ncbi:MAG TPA: LLM class flavin-dependent oxidoreductase [Sphingobium sp.]